MHKDTVLTPWNVQEPTGILYITTLAEINNSVCSEFPRTSVAEKLVPFSENPASPLKI